MAERTHMASRIDPIILRDVDPCDVHALKPHGFWYEVDGDWRRWCQAEDFVCGAYVHKVDLADCNVLFLDSLKKLDDFHDEFKKESDSFRFGRIDWKSVSEKWDGIEIAPYQWERRLHHGFMWYYGWDCASGVIWRPRNAVVTYEQPPLSLAGSRAIAMED